MGQLADDSWSDAIRQVSLSLPVPHKERLPIPGILEDDSWADPRQITRAFRRRQVPDDTWADGLRDSAMIVRHSKSCMAAHAESAVGVLADDSWADAQPNSVPSADCPTSSTVPSGAADLGAAVATSTVETQRGCGFQPPDIPQYYSKFTGRIEEVRLEDASAERLFSEMFSHDRLKAAFPGSAGLPLLVGIDFEWKPDRKTWDNHPIAVMQLACWDAALILLTEGCNTLPGWLRAFLEDPETVKVTAGFDVSDKDKLMQSFSWSFDERAAASSFVDIAELARARDIPYGMQKMAKFFDIQMLKLKVVGTSNWAKASEKGLSSLQRHYAADDPFFQLFLAGKLLEHTRPDQSDNALCRVLSSWQITLPGMQEAMQLVDNSEYRRCFYELRSVVKDAVTSLSNALGNAGCATINQILNYKPVQQLLASFQKQGCSVLMVNNSFLKQNCDILRIYFRDGELKTRLREPDDDDDDEDEAAEGAAPPRGEEDHEATRRFVAEVLEKLAAYRPPIGKQASVAHRIVPEAEWVPARAILTKRQSSQLEFCARSTDSLQVASTDGDGLIVRMVRHPRAADASGHTQRCSASLSSTLEIPHSEAQQRLEGDAKFAQMRDALHVLEAGSKDEAHVERSLRARTRILGDSARLACCVSPPVHWEEARDKLEKVKCYRQLCGDWLQSGAAAAEEQLDACITAVAQAWPDVDAVKAPAKRAREGAGNSANSSKRQRRKTERQAMFVKNGKDACEGA